MGVAHARRKDAVMAALKATEKEALPLHELSKAFGVSDPWKIHDIVVDNKEGVVTVKVITDPSIEKPHCCPTCGKPCPIYDTKPQRKWRHVNFSQYKCYVEVAIPRIQCPEHGVTRVNVPWAERGSRYTALFEATVIEWIKESSLTAAQKYFGINWHTVKRIQEQAVKRGMARRENHVPKDVCVDEIASKKGHKYVTIVSDPDTGTVLHVGDGHGQLGLSEWYANLTEEELGSIRSISMDMWQPYMKATKDYVPKAEKKIAFDRFHISQRISKAVDQVRREEQKEQFLKGNYSLKGTRYTWLTNGESLTLAEKNHLKGIAAVANKTARAWKYKERATQLWGYIGRAWAEKAWKKWIYGAKRCSLIPIKQAAKTVERHMWGIVNAVVLGVSNGPAEGINSKIKRIKHIACGFGNQESFKKSIYFHLGGLDLYPDSLKAFSIKTIH